MPAMHVRKGDNRLNASDLEDNLHGRDERWKGYDSQWTNSPMSAKLEAYR